MSDKVHKSYIKEFKTILTYYTRILDFNFHFIIYFFLIPQSIDYMT